MGLPSVYVVISKFQHLMQLVFTSKIKNRIIYNRRVLGLRYGDYYYSDYYRVLTSRYNAK